MGWKFWQKPKPLIEREIKIENYTLQGDAKEYLIQTGQITDLDSGETITAAIVLLKTVVEIVAKGGKLMCKDKDGIFFNLESKYLKVVAQKARSLDLNKLLK